MSFQGQSFSVGVKYLFEISRHPRHLASHLESGFRRDDFSIAKFLGFDGWLGRD